MFRAHERGMTGAEWVYWYYNILPQPWVHTPWIGEEEHEDEIFPEDMNKRREAFLSFKQVSLNLRSQSSHIKQAQIIPLST